ncbi:MAG: ATP-binding protein [Sphingobacterium sp.]
MCSWSGGYGKTALAAGLCRDAVKAGYKAYFRTMDEILSTLKTKGDCKINFIHLF